MVHKYASYFCRILNFSDNDFTFLDCHNSQTGQTSNFKLAQSGFVRRISAGASGVPHSHVSACATLNSGPH